VKSVADLPCVACYVDVAQGPDVAAERDRDEKIARQHSRADTARSSSLQNGERVMAELPLATADLCETDSISGHHKPRSLSNCSAAA
jgi:hypothetical protein